MNYIIHFKYKNFLLVHICPHCHFVSYNLSSIKQHCKTLKHRHNFYYKPFTSIDTDLLNHICHLKYNKDNINNFIKFLPSV